MSSGCSVCFVLVCFCYAYGCVVVCCCLRVCVCHHAAQCNTSQHDTQPHAFTSRRTIEHTRNVLVFLEKHVQHEGESRDDSTDETSNDSTDETSDERGRRDGEGERLGGKKVRIKKWVQKSQGKKRQRQNRKATGQ